MAAMNPVEKLVERYGSNAEVARQFKITREAVRLWQSNGIPPDRALEIEKMTAGKISALDILKFHQAVARKNCT